MTKGCTKIYFFIFLLTISSELLAQRSSRERINIDTDWRFALGHAADPAQDFNFKVANIFSKTGKAEDTPISPKFNDSTWRQLDLPHDWAVELPFENVDNFDLMAHGYRPVGGLFPENSVGWYRRNLELTKADSGRRLAVTFDGVFRDPFFVFRLELTQLRLQYEIGTQPDLLTPHRDDAF